MDAEALTSGFARHATTYKRGVHFFQDSERLKRISSEAGGFQVIYAGKAHPADVEGKEIIKRIFRAKDPSMEISRSLILRNTTWTSSVYLICP